MSSFLINPYIYAGPACSGNAISTLNLGYYFKFDSDLTDSSGNAHNASSTGLTYTSSKSTNYGNAAEFDGSTTKCQAPNSTDFKGSGGSLSVFCWVYVHSYATYPNPTALSNEYVPTTAGWSLQPRETDILVSWQAMSNIGRGSGVPINTWTHIGFTYDNSNVRVYQDGVQIGTNFASAGADLNSPTVLNIATNYLGAVAFDGLIDEAAIWNRKLSDSEISTLYASTCPLKA